MNSQSARCRGLASGIVLTACLLVGRTAVAEELNALVWCDHSDPRLLAPFEEAHGVRVNVKEYEGTGVALSLLEQSRPGDWDVFVVDGVDVPRVAAAGWLAELDPDDFPLDDIFPGLAKTEIHYIDGKLYAVPEKFGYNTLSYNRERVDEADMRRTSIVWEDQYAGRMAIYDYYIPVIGMVAIGLGMRPDQVDHDNLPLVRERLLAMKERAALVGDVVSVQTALATGEVDVIVGGGEYVTAVLHAENPALDWILPDDGGVRWSQSIGVFAQSERKALAVEFVKYILSPEGQARLATSSCYWAMPASMQAALGAEEKAILRWDQQPAYLERSYPYYVPDEALDAAMLDVWTEFLQH